MKVRTTDCIKSNKISKKQRSEKIRILLIDDYGLFRECIKSLLLEQKDFSVIGETADTDQAIDLVKNKKPNVILLNIELKHADRLQMMKGLLARCKTSRLLALTDSKNPNFLQKIISSGASGFITTQDSPKPVLMDAIRHLYAGGVWLDQFLSTETFLNSYKQKNRRKYILGIASLSKREREVIVMVGKGLKNKQVAERLCITYETLHHHLTSIHSKLEVENRLELIIFAFKHNLAEVPH